MESEETLVEEYMEMKITNIGYKNSIEPSKPQGYYHIYENKKGYEYLCLQGVIENESEEKLDVKNIEVYIELNSKEYEGRIRLEKKDGSDLITQLKKKEKLKVLIFFIVPLDNRNGIDMIKLKLKYNALLRKAQKQNDYTNEVFWNLDVNDVDI